MLRIPRRHALAALSAVAVLGPPAAWQAASQGTAGRGGRGGSGELWFDPTQLPSFTGTVDRYLRNPAGETDALLLREGPQVVFPPEVAEAVIRAAPPGAPLVVWGIRARKAPVITMLAFAPRSEDTPFLVERPYWRRLTAEAPPGPPRVRVAVAGKVRQPFFSPQGDPVGAILEDGTVVMLPAVPTPEGSGGGGGSNVLPLLRAGATLAAEGWGVAEGERRALMADRIGEDAQSLRPLSAGDAPPAPAATSPGRP
jgi:hypothetical protein